MARIMYAKYDGGVCRECRGHIARGDLIVYGGRGNVRHRRCCAVNANYQWARRRARTAERVERYEYDEIQRAEMAAEQAAERRLLGIREDY